jgi:hypothetical protein
LRRTPIVGTVAAAALAFTAIAFAAQENTYTVTAGVKPAKVGTKKNPIPISLDFGYTVKEKDGKRPALINRYDIFFGNGQVNTDLFPGCSAAKIDAAQSDAGCPKGSLMGTGNVENEAGATSDENARSLTCHLDLKVYNSRNNRAALFLKGGPNDPRGPAKSCPLEVNKTIDARFVKRTNGTSLVFDVDEFLLHPAPGFDNAVVFVESTIRRAVKRVNGKSRGFFESAGKCVGGKSPVKVTFRQEDGKSATQATTVPCS